MATSLFRVKRYAHPKYKFVVRAKIAGTWKRRYFSDEADAIAFAESENQRAGQTDNGTSSAPPKRAENPASLSAGPTATEKLPGPDFSSLIAPDYLGPQIQRYIGDSWSMHLPFAYDLMREVTPSVFVELGVKDGESYFTFCQSAAENKVDVKCFGIDSWRGDIQTGPLAPQVQRDVMDYNWRYSSFSELKPMVFSEALDHFADGCIDLLHIDGTHIYEDVKTDFESWLPKLAPNGIILFHDVVVRDQAFGVWKLWQEIARDDNSFLFEFGYGLGLWKRQPVSAGDSLFIRRLLTASPLERQEINHFYANAAAALALWHKANSAGPDAAEEKPMDNRVALLERRVRAKSQRAADLDRQIRAAADRIERLSRDNEAKSRAVRELEQQADKRAQEIGRFEIELVRLKAEFERERREHAQAMARLQRQLERKDDQLARTAQDLLESQWEPLTLRAAALRSSESDEVRSARLLELENRAQLAESDRDVLRRMVAGLQTDLESERNAHQSRLTELRTLLDSAQTDLAAANQSLRSYKKQIERFKKHISGKLILPFGRSQRKLEELTTPIAPKR
jgi:hypothetical protein